jgi:hypothetical protein
MSQLKTVMKFLVALAGVAGIAITQGLLTGDAAKWAGVGISIVTAVAVYLAPNAQPVP